MQSVLSVAATLACPVGMGVMTWMMMRGHGGTPQIEELRAEIERLKAEGPTDSTPGVPDVGMGRLNRPRRRGIWRRAQN
jgi:hypothetical protein